MGRGVDGSRGGGGEVVCARESGRRVKRVGREQ